MKLSDVSFAIALLAIVLLMIIPMPTFMMDILLIINISLSIIILLMALYTKDPLEFSIFPTFLLIVTLFRLVLNVSTTRLILGNQGDAGNVIRTFGNFVIRGDPVVGIVIFLIILVIQFIVITKGAERVAEVAARFTLDAMPGKQMAIDADLNTGLIDEAEARVRREAIQHEADFHGAMDGASKFIKGEAIAGLLITIINIVGGLIIGLVTMKDKQMSEIVRIFTLATIGDGLVSQIPALLVSTAAGIIVTRSGRNTTFGSEVFGQLFGNPFVLMVCGGLIFAMSLVPGLPTLPMWGLAGCLMIIGYNSYKTQKSATEAEVVDQDEAAAQEKRKPESVTTLIQINPIELELGYGLLPMVDVSQGGDLFDRIVMIRRMCALDLGVIVPVIRVYDNIQRSMNTYAIKIKGVEVAQGEVMADHLLALSTGEVIEEIDGIPTVDPTFGQPALWIAKKDREKAELCGYSAIDPPSVIATHLTHIIKRHAHELLNRQQVQTLVDNLEKTQPALVEEVIPKMFTLGELQKVLANLLREDVPIRDMATILECLADYGNITKDTELLTEYVRQNLKRAISKRFIPDDVAHVITLDPSLEQLIIENTRQSEHGSYLSLEPAQLNTIFTRLRNLVEKVKGAGKIPVILTSPLVRRQFRKIAEQVSQDLNVLSFNEIEANVEVFSEGVVKL
jgi:flagellar biosynthesis protein FlhA